MSALDAPDAYGAPASLAAKDAAFRLAGAATRLRTAVCGPFMTTAAKDLARRVVAEMRRDVTLMEGSLR